MVRIAPLAWSLSLLVTLVASPAANAGEGSEVGFPQNPSLSPDGEWIVFSWAGDLWLTSSDGGRATRLTSHPAYEGRAVFSPDGETIAFESDRSGARNLYLMTLSEIDGEPIASDIRAITASDRTATLSGFSDDGDEIYFVSRRAPGIYRSFEMYKVSIDGGPVTPITTCLLYTSRFL